jgi:AcrR family transcriptional regulator
MSAVAPLEAEAFSPRQNAVLEYALKLLVEGGEKALTTAGIARAANCSKESLYKWFGDRDGMLAAMIAYQSSKVRTPASRHGVPSLEDFTHNLRTFAVDLLTVLGGEVSLALNRLAIGQAGPGNAGLGHLLIEQGRNPIELRARGLLELGRRHGYLAFSDTRQAFETLYGLVVRDAHLRYLLGDKPDNEHELSARAELAVDQFFRLYGRQRLA